MKKIDVINEKITKAKAKLEEVKKNYEANIKKVEELNKIRASKIADQTLEPSPKIQEEIDNLTKDINLAKDTIEREGQDLIEAISSRITNFEKEKQEESVQIAYIQQKKTGKEIIALSTDLIKNLELANNTNIALREAWKNYHQLLKLTQKSVFKKDDITSQGSAQNGMLEQLTAILKWEIKNRKPRPCIEVGRIRY